MRKLLFLLSLLFAAPFVGGCSGEDTQRLFSLNVARLTVSEGLSFDFGIVSVNTSLFHTFNVTNEGPIEATQMESDFHITAFSYRGGSFPGTGGTCGSKLFAQESCTVVVEFAPPNVVAYQTPLAISYFNGVETVLTSRPTLFGQGIGPQ